MSSQPDTSPPAHAGPWPVLGLHERRVLGVLVEKAKTTPDTYPLSVNALVTGCNQKSNRDPILNLSDENVEETLVRCQQQGLAIKITGGRVIRWRHALYDAWNLSKVELAVLAELLLRGPQTEGELRTRASRMEDIADLDRLREVLRPLVQRNLVVYLTPEGRGAVVTHGFHDPAELERLRSREASIPTDSGPVSRPPSPPSRAAGEDTRAELSELRAEVAALKQRTADLEGVLTRLQEQIRALEQSRGAP